MGRHVARRAQPRPSSPAMTTSREAVRRASHTRRVRFPAALISPRPPFSADAPSLQIAETHRTTDTARRTDDARPRGRRYHGAGPMAEHAEAELLPGRDKTWVQLRPAEHAAAMCLGYDADSWDLGLAPEACMLPWSRLTSSQEAAALTLGYTQALWDAELAEEVGAVSAVEVDRLAPAPTPAATELPAARGRDKTWAEMTPAERAAAIWLGYAAQSWDDGLATEICVLPWSQLTDVQVDAALALGYEQISWDAELAEEVGDVIGQTPGTLPPPPAAAAAASASLSILPTEQILSDAVQMMAVAGASALGRDKAWAEMSMAEHAAAICLGYDAHSWDEGLAPEACMLPWSRLTPLQSKAAAVLGYSQGSWEAELAEEVGAVGAMTGREPPQSSRPSRAQSSTRAEGAAGSSKCNLFINNVPPLPMYVIEAPLRAAFMQFGECVPLSPRAPIQLGSCPPLKTPRRHVLHHRAVLFGEPTALNRNPSCVNPFQVPRHAAAEERLPGGLRLRRVQGCRGRWGRHAATAPRG